MTMQTAGRLRAAWTYYYYRGLVVATAVVVASGGCGDMADGPVAPPATEEKTAAQATNSPNGYVYVRAYLTQGVQRLNGTRLPMTAGKDALLRVWVNGWPAHESGKDSLRVPEVTARIGGRKHWLEPFDIQALYGYPSCCLGLDRVGIHYDVMGDYLPRSFFGEGSPGMSFNTYVDGEVLSANPSGVVQARISIDFEDEDTVLAYFRPTLSADTGSTVFTTLVVDVVDVPPLELVFVPVHGSVDSLNAITDSLTDAIVEQGSEHPFIRPWEQAFPSPAWVVERRPAIPFTNQMLSALDSIQSGYDEQHKYYVAFFNRADPAFDGEYAGWAVVEGTRAVSSFHCWAAWDDLNPGGCSGGSTLGHELGHNMGLLHAPCPVEWPPYTWLDPEYPYYNGSIGVWGWQFNESGRSYSAGPRSPEAVGGRPHSPDLMGYCGGYEWISDYHYDKVLDHMIGTPDAQPSSSGRVIYDPERMIAPSYQQGKEQA